jgi:arylsulfatase
MKRFPALISAGIMLVASLASGVTTTSAAEKKPNIIFIMGDDIGWSNIGVYNQGHHGGAHA